MLRKLAIAVVTVWLLPALAGAQAPRGDADVFKDVAGAVNRYTRFTVFDDVAIDVNKGAVTITGKVTMPYKSDDIAKLVSRVQGVTSVDNKIETLPTSLFDNDLRYRIARAIYGTSGFERYAVMSNPPIHIVVEHGRVTLTGVVNNEVERMLALTRASSFDAFSVTNQLMTDAEKRAEMEKLSRS